MRNGDKKYYLAQSKMLFVALNIFLESLFNDVGIGYVFANHEDIDDKLLSGTLKEDVCFEYYFIQIPNKLRIWITKQKWKETQFYYNE